MRVIRDNTHLKQIVTFIVHPHLVGWMLLGTLALAGVEDLRRRAPGQLDREGPLQEQQASGRPRAPRVRPVSQDRGHFSGPVANDSKQSAAVASRGLDKTGNELSIRLMLSNKYVA